MKLYKVFASLSCAALGIFIGTVCAQSIEAHFSPLANFAYQLDCVSGAARSCAGRDDYKALWKRELAVDTNTDIHVKRWAEMRAAYRRDIQSAGPQYSEDTVWSYGKVDFNRRIIVAAMDARDVRDYVSRLALLLPDQLIVDAKTPVLMLYPAFEQWWRNSGEKSGLPEAKRMIAELESPAIKTHIQDVFAFYGKPEIALQPHRVALMMRPGVEDRKLTSGENFGRDSLIEFLIRNSDESKVSEDSQTPVIIHEYAHYVFGATQIEKAIALRKAIVKAGGTLGLPMWNLLDEGAASAIGNGRVSRTLMSAEAYANLLSRPQSLYADKRIDLAGKALIELIDRYVKTGRSVFDNEFANDYVATLKPALGDVLASPATYLDEYALIADGALGDGASATLPWANEFKSRSRWSYAMKCCDGKFASTLEQHVSITRVVLVSVENLDALAGTLGISAENKRSIDDALRIKDTTAAVLTSSKGGGPMLIIVAVKELSALPNAAKKFAMQTKLAEGLLIVK